jgi:hypothetical protein
MIISHKHRYIFVKTQKTGGTSVEISLSRFAGVRDVVTPLFEDDEALRRSCGGIGPQNVDVPVWRWRRQQLAQFRHRRPARYYNHMPAIDIRRSFPFAWRDYLTFTIERNPWDLVISSFYWKTRPGGTMPGASFDEFLASDLLLRASNWHSYTDGKNVIVDRVLRYETLQQEFDDVSRELGLPPSELPNAKSQYRTDRRPYAERLTPRQRDLIARAFAREIEAFGYAWSA